MILLLLGSAVLLSGVLAVPLIRLVVAPGVSSSRALTQQPFVFLLFIALEDLAFLLVVYLALFRTKATTLREMGLTGMHAGSVLRGLGWGVLFIVVSGALSTLLAGFGVQQDQAQQFPLADTGVLGRIAIFVAAGLLAPVAEEVFFRGYVFRAITARKGLARGLLYSSFLFGLVHLNLAAFLPIAVGALLLAVAYHRSGDLWTAIIAHAVNNIFAFSVLFFGLS